MVKPLRFFGFALLVSGLFFGGCAGYTQKSLLSERIKNVYVAPVKNAIDLSGEITDKNPFRVYRPGVEVDITNAIMNRFIFDGNLKVTLPERADATVEAKLVDYRRDALRYSDADDVEEYRLSITLDVAVYETRTHKVLWHETGVTGDTSFFLSGPRSISEDAAAQRAVEDLAKRVVDKTIEIW